MFLTMEKSCIFVQANAEKHIKTRENLKDLSGQNQKRRNNF